jgi:membrane-associated protease RseP (regulator of RpoE activity)
LVEGDRTLYELPPPPRHRRVLRPAVLFGATCLSTVFAGGVVETYYVFSLFFRHSDLFLHSLAIAIPYGVWQGLQFAVPLMTILVCHEAGHFVQAWRHGVYASYPYFIPWPVPPLGTMGAVIAMEPRIGHRRALFDIGITGPLVGLAPTIIFCVVGLSWSEVLLIHPRATRYGDPLVMRFMAELICGPIPPGSDVFFHKMAFAGWAGLLLTSINLMPIGQLDGGHVLYSLLPRWGNMLMRLFYLAAAIIVVAFWRTFYTYTLLVILLALMGPAHPPTDDDREPLGWWRFVLGWATLAFLPFGFTPTPFILPP